MPEHRFTFVSSRFLAHERALDPVRRFINSRRVEDRIDAFDSPETAGLWLSEQGYERLDLSYPELETYRMARETLRTSFVLPGDESAEAVDQLVRRWAIARPAIRFNGDNWVAGLEPLSVHPSHAPLQRILLSLWKGACGGELNRLKICADHRCQLAYYDSSRNRSRRWCTGGGCGNRDRVARHRQRLRERVGQLH